MAAIGKRLVVLGVASTLSGATVGRGVPSTDAASPITWASEVGVAVEDVAARDGVAVGVTACTVTVGVADTVCVGETSVVGDGVVVGVTVHVGSGVGFQGVPAVGETGVASGPTIGGDTAIGTMAMYP